TLLDARIVATESVCQSLRDQLHGADTGIGERQEEIAVLAEQDAEMRSRVQRHQDRRQGLHEEVAVSRDEIQRIEQEVQMLEDAWRQNEAHAAGAESLVQTLHARLHQADEETH